MATTSTSAIAEEIHDPPPQPLFIDTVAELRNLAASMSTFTRRYDDLQAHLEYIRHAIDSELPQHIVKTCIPEQSIPASSTKMPMESASKFAKENTTTPPPEQKVAEPVENSPKKPIELELQALCKEMFGRELRRYVSTHLSDASKLREELPIALKLAKNPAKLVLDSVGRFYLQGSAAYVRDPKLNRVREVSIVILECFLRMGVDVVAIEPAIKEEADVAAEAWRNRLKNEGGILKATEHDAQGLLFLISGFGVPRSFTHEPLRDLITRCNSNGIYGVLRHSTHLISKIPAVLDKMLKDKEHINAVNIAYTFEVDGYQLPVLKAYLKEMKGTWTKAKTKGRSTSLAAVNRANNLWLTNMISVVNCLKEKGLDHSKLLPEWKLDEKISHLKKEVSDLENDIKDKKREEAAKPKRKIEEIMQPSQKSKSPKVRHVQQHVNGNAASPSAYGESFGWQRDAVGPTSLGQASILGLPDQHQSHERYPGLLDQQHQSLVERYLNLPDQHRRSPERYPGLPDRLRRSPERYPGFPEQLRRSPERYPGFPEQLRRSPERYPGFPDKFRRSPERYPGFPDQRRRSPERFPGLSDQHRRSPERIPGLSDRHRRSLERHHGFPDERFAGLPEHHRPFESFGSLAGQHRSLEGFAGLPGNWPERASGRSLGSGLYQFADSVLEAESTRRGGGSDRATFPADQR
jgi:hypothetical protein